MHSVDLSFNVTDLVPLADRCVVAATVHLPDALLQRQFVDDQACPTAPLLVAVGLPGGGYNRGYYNLQPPDHDGYSQAEFHTARGWLFVACDPMGVGGSTRPSAPQSIADVALVQAAAVRMLRERLSAGTLVPGLAAVEDMRLIGIGQSMGGCFTVAAQGAHGCYDAIAVLGFSALHTELPLPEGTVAAVPEVSGRGVEMQEAVAAALMASFGWVFHWEDVPLSITQADLASVPMRQGPDVPAWGVDAASLPCGIDMLTPGVVATEAAAISCPVLIAQGERDVVPRPRDEPSAYSGSQDLTVYVVPGMAHMHNFAMSRQQLWQRIQSWGDSLANSRMPATSPPLANHRDHALAE